MGTTKKRITIAISEKHLEKLNYVKKLLKTKNNQKAIEHLLDITIPDKRQD